MKRVSLQLIHFITPFLNFAFVALYIGPYFQL
jgi:hypothetical protein